MTTIRRHKLLNEIIGYIAEVIDQDEEIYNVLHGTIGMTHAEIRECGIDYLDDYFQAETDQERLMQKIEHSYQQCKSKWSKMTPEQIINTIDEVYAVTAVYRIISRSGVSEDDASWLVRFRNPLVVVSDAWQLANDIDCLICEERMDALIKDLQDRGDVEADYVMEDEQKP